MSMQVMDDRRSPLQLEPLYSLDFAIAFVGQTLFVTGNTLLIHYTRWVDFLGGDERDIGLVMGLAPVLSLLLRPWMGQWIDRVGARTASVIGGAIVVASTLVNVAIFSIGVGAYLSRTGQVIGGAIFFASSLTYITQSTPPSRRTEAIGVLGCGGFLGMVIGPLFGDWLLPIGVVRTRHDFLVLFGFVVVSIVLALLLLNILRSSSKPNRGGTMKLGHFIQTASSHWPGTILIVNAVFGVGLCIPFVFLSKYVDVLGLKNAGMGLYFVVYAGWGMILRLSTRKLPDRIGRRAMLLSGLAIMGVASFSYSMIDADHPGWLLICAFLSGSAHSLMFHTMMALTLEPFPLEQHGTGTVLAYMCLDFGMIASAPLLGYVAHHVGYHAMFRIVGTACVLAVGIYAATCRNRATVEFPIESEILSPGEEIAL